MDLGDVAQQAVTDLWQHVERGGRHAVIHAPRAWVLAAVRGRLIDRLRARSRERDHAPRLRASVRDRIRPRPSDAQDTCFRGSACSPRPLTRRERWLVALLDAGQSLREVAELSGLDECLVRAALKACALRIHSPAGDGDGLPWLARAALLERAGFTRAEVAALLGVTLACLKKRLQRAPR